MFKTLKGWPLIFATAATVCSVIAILTGHGHLIPLFFMPLIGGV